MNTRIRVDVDELRQHWMSPDARGIANNLAEGVRIVTMADGTKYEAPLEEVSAALAAEEAALAEVARRPPVEWATYRGDCTGILTEGPKGPNNLGELLWPVTALYDPEAGKTRVGFSYLAPANPTDLDRRQVIVRTGKPLS